MHTALLQNYVCIYSNLIKSEVIVQQVYNVMTV